MSSIHLCLFYVVTISHTKPAVGMVSAKARLILLFHISRIYSICMQAGSHYSFLTNAMYTQQMYGATAVKSGCVIAQKAIMTVEAAGFDQGSGH